MNKLLIDFNFDSLQYSCFVVYDIVYIEKLYQKYPINKLFAAIMNHDK